MSEGCSLINLGNISKPATVLIEKVSSAVGIIFEPTRIRRKAIAEAEAAKIATVSNLELREIEHRALERFVHQETRKQENIESITAQAAEALTLDANADKLDEDWIAHFFKQCDTVSDKEMQSLWSRLLAGEATTPGSFSKRTVDFVSSIDKQDAALFSKFCQFAWMLGDLCPLIYDVQDEIYSSQGITFNALKHLDSIGLISFESVSGYKRKGFTKYVHFFYFGQPTLAEFPADTDNNIELGHVLLTKTGLELAPICGAVRNMDFYDYVISRWHKNGLIVSSPFER